MAHKPRKDWLRRDKKIRNPEPDNSQRDPEAFYNTCFGNLLTASMNLYNCQNLTWSAKLVGKEVSEVVDEAGRDGVEA